MQVNEAFSVRKIEGSIRTSTGVMRDVNSLVRLPELTGTMRELSMELVKAGIIEEMVADSLPDDVEMEDDEVEEEVEKALREVMGGTVVAAPAAPVSPEKGIEEEEDQDTLDDMRERLEMLKS